MTEAEPSPANPIPDEARAVNQGLAPTGFRGLLGYQTRVWREGHAEIALVVARHHLNNLGFAHGGVYATLLDTAMGQAVAWARIKGNTRNAVTSSLTTHFLIGAQPGTLLVARAQVVATTGRIATCQADVIDADGTTYALGQASFIYLHGSEDPNGVPRAASAQI